MMADCSNPKLSRMLHAYELGMLTEGERAEIEAHILECDACASELATMARATALLQHSVSARERVREATREVVLDHAAPSLGRRIPWRVLVPVAVTCGLALLFILKDWQLEIKPSAPVVASESRVAVLPFENLAESADSTRLGEIVGNLLVTGLSESPSLQVVSSQYVYDLTTQIDPQLTKTAESRSIEIARRAGARYLVTGAITQVTPTLAIGAQIVDVSTGTVKAAFRDTMAHDGNVFAAVDRLAQSIKRGLLKPAIASGEKERSVAEMTTSSPAAYQEYIRGLDLWRKAYVDDAVPHFQKAVQIDSTFAMAYYYLATMYTGAERRALIAKSVRYVERAGERDRFLIRSRAAFAHGKAAEGLKIVDEFVTRYPDEKEPLLMAGRTLYGLGRFDAARDRLHAAIGLDSSCAEAYNLLAYVNDRMGNILDAFRAADRYVALVPNEANPYDSRAEIYARNGDLDQAIASYRRALEIKPDLYASVSYLGIMYTFKEDYQRAESCFVALSGCPIEDARVGARLYLAYLPGYRGQFDSSIAFMTSAITADSSANCSSKHAFEYCYQAVQHEAVGRIPEAITCQRKSVHDGRDSDPTDVNRTAAYLIHLLASSGDMANAEIEAGKLKGRLDSLHASLSAYNCAMGSIALANDKPDSAVYWLEQAARSYAFYDGYLLSMAYLRSHKLAEAVDLMKKLSSCYTSPRMFWTPWSVKLHYHLGLAYEESRWYEQAKGEYGLFVRIWEKAEPTPELADARDRLKRLEVHP